MLTYWVIWTEETSNNQIAAGSGTGQDAACHARYHTAADLHAECAVDGDVSSLCVLASSLVAPPYFFITAGKTMNTDAVKVIPIMSG